MREPPVGMRSQDLTAEAVVFQGDKELAIDSFELVRPEEDDLVVDVFWSGVSTGTEKLLWTGDMPTFPGFSYPLVPGYEAVGRVIACDRARRLIGRTVFVPGANCYSGARGLFGASASRIVVPMRRAVVLDGLPKIESTLLALAATAHHAVLVGGLPDLVIGHGTLGRLVARMTMALGGDAPTVWEIDPDRCDGDGYAVCHPDEDERANYSAICDVSGNINAIDNGIAHAARGGVLTLGGFYAERPSFAFPP
ncbi:MAG: chlorophyll synthesis pathway protein BchC, partial [Pseudomonadota bacterium]